jgi:prolipoprotein diacylglyceryltransferase
VILRPRRLADALAADSLSERDKFHYLLIWAVFGIVVGQLVGTSPRWDNLRLLATAPSLLITVAGLVACFQANARGDNRAFLERYLCLSVPVGLVTSAVYYLLYYGMGLVGLRAGWVESDASNWNGTAMALVGSVIALTLFYIWMRALMARAAGLRTA